MAYINIFPVNGPRYFIKKSVQAKGSAQTSEFVECWYASESYKMLGDITSTGFNYENICPCESVINTCACANL